MSNLRQMKRWAQECRTGHLERREFLQRALLIGGSVPVALALLQQVGVSADAAEISDARGQSTDVDHRLGSNPLEHTRDAAGELLRCSFCNQDQNDTRKLIAGPSAVICDECVDACRDIIADAKRFVAGSVGCVVCGWPAKDPMLVSGQYVCLDCAAKVARALESR
jgi:hypothetical protein